MSITQMRKSVAVLVTGAIRNSIDMIVENIQRIKKSMGNMDVHVYFHTWNPNAEFPYTEEDLNRVQNEVHFCMTSPELDKAMCMDVLAKCIHATDMGYKTFSMFYAIYQLSNVVTDRYDYVCRLRNDLCIVDSFDPWFELLDNKVAQYVVPISLYTYNDGCSDHFGIATQENFRKLWHGSWFDLLRDFIDINECPEKMLIAKMNRLGFKIYCTIPYYYRFKETELIVDGKIIMDKINLYMVNYLSNFANSPYKFFAIN